MGKKKKEGEELSEVEKTVVRIMMIRHWSPRLRYHERSSIDEYAKTLNNMRVFVLSITVPALFLIKVLICTHYVVAQKEMWRDGPIIDAIENGAAVEYDKNKCVWRQGNDRDICPDPDVYIYLYTPGKPRQHLDPLEQSDWLRQDYEPTKDNIILIHGYAGNL